MSDFALQRKNMVESQIRPSDVTDRRIIRAMQSVPREAFVPETVRGLAYMDGPVTLDPGAGRRGPARPRQLMSPRVFAKLLVLADLEETDNALVVGSGCGYSAAVLAEIVASVVALEVDGRLIDAARKAVEGTATASKITFVEGPLQSGHQPGAPYDVILIEGAVPEIPQAILAQLADGGRCIGIVERGGVGLATRCRKVQDRIAETDAFEAAVASLPGFALPKTFVL